MGWLRGRNAARSLDVGASQAGARHLPAQTSEVSETSEVCAGHRGQMLRPYIWLAVLLAIGLAVRLAYLAQVAFPPLDDPTFYLQTAANLAQGRGLVIDAIWSYQVPWQTVTHPSHEYWMPLATFLIAGAYSLFGISLRSGQVPGLLCGLGLVALTYRVARGALKQRSLAVAAGFLVAISGPLAYQSVSADSSAPFALLGSAAVVSIARARTGKQPWAFALSGALVALAYLARPDGALLLAVAVIAWWPLLRDVRAGWPRLALAAGGFALFVAPWLVRNALVFGAPLPGGTLGTILQLEYTDQFRYPYALVVPPLADLLAVRGKALVHCVYTLLLIGFPYAIVSPFGFASLCLGAQHLPAQTSEVSETSEVCAGHYAVRLGGWYLLLMGVILPLVFPVPTLAGTFYHSVGAALPFAAVAAVGGLVWIAERVRASNPRRLFVALFLAVALLSLGQTALSLRSVGQMHGQQAHIYSEAGAWLAGHTKAPVVTTQPHTLNYVTGLPAVALPAGQLLEVAREVARKYGAEYVCLTHRFGLYPDAMRGSPLFELAHKGDGFEIYRVVP